MEYIFMMKKIEKEKEYFILTVQEILKGSKKMIDEKKLLKVLEDWSDYRGKKTDGISLLKWATILRFKALIKSQPKIESCLENQEETR